MGAHKQVPPTMPNSLPAPRPDSEGEICRLYGEEKCQRGATCKRILGARARNPSPSFKARMGRERQNRKRRGCRHGPSFSSYLGQLTPALERGVNRLATVTWPNECSITRPYTRNDKRQEFSRDDGVYALDARYPYRPLLTAQTPSGV